MRNSIIIIGVLIAAFISIKFFATFGEYSEGERTGQLTKFSKKGFMWETYEGEILLGGMKTNSDGGAMANIFEFSVTDQSVIDTLIANPGATMTIHYTEYFNVNIAEGASNYLISHVTVHRE